MSRFDYVTARREDVRQIPLKYEGIFRRAARVYGRLNLLVYKLSGGRLMKNGPADKPICLVTMVGRKSGKTREVPLMHVPHGEQKILVASLGGTSRNPIWYYNLKATPRGHHRRRRSSRHLSRTRGKPEGEGSLVASPRRRLPTLRHVPGPLRPRHPGLHLRPSELAAYCVGQSAAVPLARRTE